MFTTFTVKDKDYKLKLTARACVELEKKLGTNPLNILSKMAETEEVPSFEVLLNILHAAMEHFNHGISMNEVYDIYDDFVDEGKTMIDLVPIILDIFKTSGFIRAENEKN